MVILIMMLNFLACINLHNMQGAKPIPEGSWEVGMATSLQANSSFSKSSGIPVPQAELSIRRGLNPYTDMGLRLYVGGALLDFRYHFLSLDGWDFAIQPSIGGFTTGVLNYTDLRMPIIAEHPLNEKYTFVTGIVPISQNVLFALPAMQENTLNNYMGTFLRLERNGNKRTLGGTCNFYYHSPQGLRPVFSCGMDIARVRKK